MKDMVKDWKPNQNLIAFIFVSAIYFTSKIYEINLPDWLEVIFIISILIFIITITLTINWYSWEYISKKRIRKD